MHQHRENRGLAQMSLKRVVNDPEIWGSIVDLLQEEKLKYTQRLSLSVDTVDIYRTQGRLAMLEHFLRLKESVNGKSTR
jgi:hypothetical protein